MVVFLNNLIEILQMLKSIQLQIQAINAKPIKTHNDSVLMDKLLLEQQKILQSGKLITTSTNPHPSQSIQIVSFVILIILTNNTYIYSWKYIQLFLMDVDIAVQQLHKNPCKYFGLVELQYGPGISCNLENKSKSSVQKNLVSSNLSIVRKTESCYI